LDSYEKEDTRLADFSERFVQRSQVFVAEEVKKLLSDAITAERICAHEPAIGPASVKDKWKKHDPHKRPARTPNRQLDGDGAQSRGKHTSWNEVQDM
jgi:hypothetical protein